MRLTILGCGTCVPSGIRNSAGFWVEAGSARLRLDCGAGTVHAMARACLPWETLTHQAISHFHIDHVGELAAMLFAFRYGRSRPRSLPLQLVGPAGLRALVEKLEAAYDQKLLEQQFPVEVRELEPGASLDLGGAILRVAKTPHSDESLAYRIEAGGRSLGYTGDTLPSEALARFFAGVDTLIAECSFLDDKRGTKHLAADETARLAAASAARRLIAVHSYFDPDAGLADRLAKNFGGEIVIGRDGMALDV
jgi:ribonuclease BN (tRNA processing enzyme)